MITFQFAQCDNKKNSEYAEQELKLALKDTLQDSQFYFTGKVTDESSAIKAAEPILFNIYGEKNIKQQRPYQVYNTQKYWVIWGTLNEEYSLGGVFLIILNAQNNRVLRIIHGK
ncbi:MAG: YbbC/YhhH family protein [Bacteroidetes bacterium]|nr:YbbC/YhhH family protein [Bacteroidota bacterium]